jgi:hypothetical protein
MSEIVRYRMPFYDDGVEFVKAADCLSGIEGWIERARE